MHERGIDIELLKDVLTQGCFAPCNRKRQQMMSTLEQMETSPGFLSGLMRIVDLTDVGAEMPNHCRQLAAIIFKTTTLKYWIGEGQYVISAGEREDVKDFLLTYLAESECNIAIQLCTLVAAIAKHDWPQQWPQLIPTLLDYIAKHDTHALVSFRATMYLHNVFQELAVSPSPTNVLQTFHSTCVQSFHIIIRIWAIKSKWIQDYLSNKSNVIHSEEVVLSRDYHFDLIAYQISSLMRILRIILESSLPEIIAKYQCFSNFWKTYLASIQSLTSFVQKVRPLCRSLVDGHHCHGKAATVCNYIHAQSQTASVESKNEAEIEKCIAEKLCLMEEEQAEDQKDYFISRKYYDVHTEGIFSLVNTVLMLLRCQNCTPVVLQRKYPMLVAPWLEALLSFYCKHLMEEYSTERTCPLKSSHQPCDLPLKYLSMASTVFIANVLNCPQYQQVPAAAANVMSSAPCSSSGAGGCGGNSGNNNNHPYFIRERFFSVERSQALLERVFRHLLCFSGKDIQSLLDEEEVEVFYQQHVALSWHDDEIFTLRTFAEKIFCGLLGMQPKLCLHVLANHLQQQSTALSRVDFTIDTMSIEDVKLWDNLCYVSNIAIAKLTEELSFQPSVWIENVLQSSFLKSLFSYDSFQSELNAVGVSQQLTKESRKERQVAKALLQTRFLWLFQAWMNVLDTKLYPVMLQYLMAILQETKVHMSNSSSCDAVDDDEQALVKLCRLTLFRTLQSLLQQSQFSFVYLIPHVPLIFQEGIQMILKVCHDQDIRVMLLEILHDIVRWMGVIDLSNATLPNIIIANPQQDSTPGAVMMQLCLHSCQHFAHAWYEMSPSDIIRRQYLELLLSLNQSMGKFSARYPQYCQDSFYEAIISNMVPIVIQCLQLEAVHKTAKCHSPLPKPPTDISSKGKMPSDDLYVKEGLLLWLAILRNLTLQSLHKDFVCNFGNLFIFALNYFRDKASEEEQQHHGTQGQGGDEEVSVWQTEEVKLLFLSLLEVCLLQFGQKLMSIPPAKTAVVEYILSLCSKCLQSLAIKQRVCRCFELLLIVNPQEGISLLLETHCLQYFMMSLIRNSLEQLPPSQGHWGMCLQNLATEEEAPNHLKAHFAAVLARVLLAEPARFLEILNAFGQQTQCPLELKTLLLFFIQKVILLCQEEVKHNDDAVLRTRLFLSALLSILPQSDSAHVWKDVFSLQEMQEQVFPQILLLAVANSKLHKSLLRNSHHTSKQTNALHVLASQLHCQLSTPFQDEFEQVGLEAVDNLINTTGDSMGCWEDLTQHQLTPYFLSTHDEEELHTLLHVLAHNSYHQVQNHADNCIVNYEENVYCLHRRVVSELDPIMLLKVNEVLNERLMHWKQVVGLPHYHELLFRVQQLITK